MVRRCGLVLGLAIAIPLVWSASAFAASTSTLTLTGITGAGTKIAPVLTAQTFSWGIGFGSQTGGYTGKGQVRSQSVSGGEFTITVASDKSIASLMNAAAAGRHFADGSLEVRKAGETDPYLTASFTDLVIAKLQMGTNPNNSLPTASLTFAYQSVSLQYAAQSTDCSLGRQTWLNMSHATPAVDPATGGIATDALTEFMPVVLGNAGPGHVSVGSAAQADSLLTANGANGLANLRAQTLAARMNISAGGLDPTSVSSQLTQSDQFLGAHAPSSWGSLDAATQSSIIAVVNQLSGKRSSHRLSAGALCGNADAAVGARAGRDRQRRLHGGARERPARQPRRAGTAWSDQPGDGARRVHRPHRPVGPVHAHHHRQQPRHRRLTGGADTRGADVRVGRVHRRRHHRRVDGPHRRLRARQESAGRSQDPGHQRQPVQPVHAGCAQRRTMNLVPTAGGTISTNRLENGFTLQNLAAGTYGLSESVPGYAGVTVNGGGLPAVQMPAQPASFADGSAARYMIIVVAEPAPETGGC